MQSGELKPVALEGQVLGGDVLAKQFLIYHSVGKGSFGEVRLARRLLDGEAFAVKFEEKKADSKPKPPHLRTENDIMLLVKSFAGFPRALHLGFTDRHHFLVMTQLGQSLQSLHDATPEKRFSPKTILSLTIQAIKVLQSLHTVGYIHADIKPENFMVGCGAEINTLYLVDFGLSQRWRREDGNHIPLKRKGSGITGTLRYCSINVHDEHELSRRDDLESLIYCMIYLYRGKLEWQNQTGDKTEKRMKVKEIKKRTGIDVLCKGLPYQYEEFLRYVRGLRFEEEPRYSYCIQLMDDGMRKHDLLNDGIYEWMVHRPAMIAESSKKMDTHIPLPAYIPPTKRIQEILGEDLRKAQWVLTVTRRHEGQVQKFAHESDYNTLIEWLKEKGWGSDHGLYITSLVHSQETDGRTLWNCVLSSNTQFRSQQIKKCSSPISAEQWILKKRAEDYKVTCISGHVHNSCVVVVVSKVENALPNQVMTFSETFPSLWIEGYMQQKYFITSLGVSGTFWLVVMSDCSDVYTKQIIKNGNTFPASEIKGSWANGLRLTSMASKNKQIVVVMSQLTGRASSQGYNCSNIWPVSYISEAESQNRYVTAIAWKLESSGPLE